ncbi:MAG: hypothetical protein ABGX26_05945 [Nautiliaceae bacterium]
MKFLLSIIIAIFIFSGCAEDAFNQAAKINTPKAYQNFLKEYNDEDDEYVKEAKLRLKILKMGLAKEVYVKKEYKKFKKGEKIRIKKIDDYYAYTKKGKIPLSFLEKNRSEFKLHINAPFKTTFYIKELKKSITSPNLWLKNGSYTIVAHKFLYYPKTFKITINNKDINKTITLKRKKFNISGEVDWRYLKTNKDFWRKKYVPVNLEKMSLYEATGVYVDYYLDTHPKIKQKLKDLSVNNKKRFLKEINSLYLKFYPIVLTLKYGKPAYMFYFKNNYVYVTLDTLSLRYITNSLKILNVFTDNKNTYVRVHFKGGAWDGGCLYYKGTKYAFKIGALNNYKELKNFTFSLGKYTTNYYDEKACFYGNLDIDFIFPKNNFSYFNLVESKKQEYGKWYIYGVKNCFEKDKCLYFSPNNSSLKVKSVYTNDKETKITLHIASTGSIHTGGKYVFKADKKPFKYVIIRGKKYDFTGEEDKSVKVAFEDVTFVFPRIDKEAFPLYEYNSFYSSTYWYILRVKNCINKECKVSYKFPIKYKVKMSKKDYLFLKKIYKNSDDKDVFKVSIKNSKVIAIRYKLIDYFLAHKKDYQETEDFKKAIKQNTLKSLYAFKRKYPHSKYLSKINNKILNIKYKNAMQEIKRTIFYNKWDYIDWNGNIDKNGWPVGKGTFELNKNLSRGGLFGLGGIWGIVKVRTTMKNHYPTKGKVSAYLKQVRLFFSKYTHTYSENFNGVDDMNNKIVDTLNAAIKEWNGKIIKKSTSSSNCERIFNKCMNYCKTKSTKGFFDQRSSCEGYCYLGKRKCERGNYSFGKRLSCAGICKGAKEGNGGFLWSSDYDKCIDKCIDVIDK